MTDETMETETPTTNQEETVAPETTEGENLEQSKELQSAIAQKEHFRKKYEEAQAKLSSETRGGIQGQKDSMETVRISRLLGNYNDEESSFILDRAKSQSYDAIKKAAEDEWSQMAIHAMREKVAKENKVPAPGSSSPFASSEKSSEEIAKMTSDEHRAYEAKVVKERMGRGI